MQAYNVQFVSLNGFAEALSNHRGAFYNPQLMFVRTKLDGLREEGESKVKLIAVYSRPAMDENGFEIGFENWMISFNIFHRPDLGLHLGLPYMLDPYVVNPKDYKITVLSYPAETSFYDKPTEDDLHEVSEYVVETALDNMPEPKFDPESREWTYGGYHWKVGEPRVINIDEEVVVW